MFNPPNLFLKVSLQANANEGSFLFVGGLKQES